MRAAASAIALAFVAFPASAQLAPDETRGRAIYFGEPGSALDTTTARIPSAGDASLPAKSFACSSCHGQRGEGRAERGVKPANLDRAKLTKPYGQALPGGRVRAPYDFAAFAKALSEGHDPMGRELSPAMPRYALDSAAAQDLWAFLGKIGTLQDPGLSATTVKLGAALALSGPMAEEGRQMQRILQTIVDATNQGGGIHGRKLVLVVHDAASVSEPPSDVFVWLSASAPSDLARLSAGGAPVFAPWRHEGAAPSEGVFFLTARESDQSAALAAFANETLTAPRQKACSTSGTLRIVEKRCTSALSSHPSKALLTLEAFQSLSDKQRAALPGDTWVALPVDHSQISGATQKTFARLHARISPHTMLAQAHAYTSAALAIELLKRSGRTLSRETMLDHLAKLTQFSGGMTPPLSFSGKRGIGSTGALIVRFDKKTDALSAGGTWIDS